MTAACAAGSGKWQHVAATYTPAAEQQQNSQKAQEAGADNSLFEEDRNDTTHLFDAA